MKVWTVLIAKPTSCNNSIYNVHVLMRDDKEGRKKQARSNKQQGMGNGMRRNERGGGKLTGS